MTVVTRPASRCLAVALIAVCPALLRGDEGMWTFHNPPRQILKDRYGIEVSDAWLEHVRLSSVRFNSGGSGSFVSADGLVLTNHHVAMDSIAKLSTAERDLVHDGFYARARVDELRCPDLELNVLVAMTDVTDRVKGAMGQAADSADAAKKKRAEIGRIEGEARGKSGLRSDVVELYRGGEYWLYEYQQFTDVRLVFAPEEEIGFFGGDYDNFTYPRFNLDFAVFRVYQDDRPLQPQHYLRWNPDDLKDGDVVFVSGHPGRTERLMTVDQLVRLRDVERPRSLATLQYLGDALRAYGSTGPEQARQTIDVLAGIENSKKAFTGQYEGLLDERLLDRKRAEEAQLQDALRERPELRKRVGDAIGDIRTALAEQASYDNARYFRRMRSDQAGFALDLVRHAAELEKPNEERLPPYRESSLDSLKLRLVSEVPIYPGMEEVMLRAGLELAKTHLPADDPFLQRVLGGASPAEVARRLIGQTSLGSAAERQRLFDGGSAAIAASQDPLVRLMHDLDPLLREVEERQEKVAAILSSAAARLAEARFEILGNKVYPDATFTLRLAFGKVHGYEEDTTLVPWKTSFYGLYGRAQDFGFRDPFHLPARFRENEARVDLATPLNFVHDADITGGNSGSPTLNRAGELVGLIFDGNIQSLPNDFVFANGADRAVSVHAAGILEALLKIYDAGPLVRELLGDVRSS